MGIVPPKMERKLNKILLKTGAQRTANSLAVFGIISTFILGIIGTLLAVLVPSLHLEIFSHDSIALALLVNFFFYLVIGLVVAFGGLYIFVTLKIYNRRKEIELVLADYLQLVAANVNSGLPIDQALWYAVRPRFGILSKEIEIVAKKTMTGSDLDTALFEFAEKYDSDVLKKSIVLLVEGINAGGAVGDLLNMISWNIKETEIMKKEVSASVMTYTIFILFSTLVAAPLLFAVANQLIELMETLLSNIDMGSIESAVGQSQLPLTIGEVQIESGQFKKFIYVMLTISSSFAAMIISSVRKGSVKDGLKYIPIFIAISIALYLIFAAIAGKFFGGMTI